MSEQKKNTYGQILKSSALIGSSSAIGLGFGIIRTKAMAVILGPAGVGLIGNFSSIIELVRTFAGLGISNSGVRQIAEAVGSGDEQRVARTVKTLRRVALWSGTLGALLLAALCVPTAQFTFTKDIEVKNVIFDTHAQVVAIALLAIAVLFMDISGGQIALVQGMRRIGDLAKINVLGAFYGTLFSVPIVYVWGARGVVPSLICVAGMSILTSWWYARKIKVPEVKLERGQFAYETRELLKMGLVFMASGLMTAGVAYLVRVIITKQIDIVASGYYQAAWTMGGFYIGYVVSAMGTDFYPRLTAVAHNREECNRMVNEQTEVGVLLAVPGLIAMLTFSGWLMHLLYSKQFGDAPVAVELLRWICLGMILRVASWPLGFVLLARGERKLYFWSEFLGNAIFVAFVWGGAHEFGLKGVGIAFFAMYLVYWFGIFVVVNRLTGFQWSSANIRLGLVFVPLVGAVFVAGYFLSPINLIILGTLAVAVSGIYSLRTLCTLIPLKKFPRMAQNLLLFLRLAPSSTDAPAG